MTAGPSILTATASEALELAIQRMPVPDPSEDLAINDTVLSTPASTSDSEVENPWFTDDNDDNMNGTPVGAEGRYFRGVDYSASDRCNKCGLIEGAR